MAIEFIGADTATSSGTAVTSNTTADTYGSYVELVASTARESHLITVDCVATTAGATASSIVDVAIGAASSEVVLFSFLIPHAGLASGNRVQFTFPYTIAASTRVAARSKNALTGGKVVDLTLALSDDDSWGTSTSATLIGESGGKGAVVDPGGTANTKGAYTQLVASSANDYDYIVVFAGNNRNNIATAATWLVDIATGAAASETDAVENIMHSVNIFEIGQQLAYPIYVPITSGTRVSARAQCSITDATDRLIDVAILGVNLTAPAGGGGGGGGIKLAGRGGGLAG